MAKVVRVVFELSMPCAASWNGKWNGADAGHYIFKEYSPAAFESKWKSKVIGEWSYRWDDGWEACITSRVIDGNESRRLKRANRGFCGYDWMVDSILLAGKIMETDGLREYLNAREAAQSGSGEVEK